MTVLLSDAKEALMRTVSDVSYGVVELLQYDIDVFRNQFNRRVDVKVSNLESCGNKGVCTD